MKTFFVSDTHFGHKNIIKYCNRPFANVDEMDREMVRRWNAKVSNEDEIYHLGDFAFAKDSRVSELLHSLNGRKHFLRGNHDNSRVYWHECWTSQMSGIVELVISGKKLVLCHYPIEDWDGKFRGVLHFHGHSHGTCRKIDGRWDVGVDCFNYEPVTLEEIF